MKQYALLFFLLMFVNFTWGRDADSTDKTAPIITLKGDAAISVCRWFDYKDAGYEVSDNYWPSKDITVTIEGSFVSTEMPGLFTLRYKAVDKSGNYSYSGDRYILVKSENDPSCGPCIVGGQTNHTSGISIGGGQTLYVAINPNPSTGKVFIDNSMPSVPVAITIYNLNGQQVFKVDSCLFKRQPLDLSDLPGGVYFAHVGTSEGNIVEKIVLQK
jgi:hypothetical protein